MSTNAPLRAACLLLLPLLCLPVAAVADDLAELVAALSGGGVKARLTTRIDPDGGASGAFTATLEGLPPGALAELVERGNGGLAKQADRLAKLGVVVGRLVRTENEGTTRVRVTASCNDLAALPAALSPRDPVELTATREKGLLAVRAAPRPALYLLAPFLAAFELEVALPGEPAAHNATDTKGNLLYWRTARTLPTVEFTLRAAPARGTTP